MSLFADDLAMLHRRLKEVVGRDAVTARPFVGRPRGDRSTPPPAGTPVLAATDLGIARPLFSDVDVEPGDWLAFADDLRRAGCPLVAFVPYGPGRWPSALLGAFPILQWDRTTTVSTVLARIGRSLSL